MWGVMKRKRFGDVNLEEEEGNDNEEPTRKLLTPAPALDELIEEERDCVTKGTDLFSTLPDEMVVAIFSYLNLNDVLTGVSWVSRRLSKLSIDHFTELTVRRDFWFYQKVVFDGLLASSNRFRRLRIFASLDNRAENQFALPLAVTALKRCPRLESLALYNFSCPAFTELLCRAIRDHGISLRRLSWQGDPSLLDPTSLLNLTHLHLHNESRITCEVLLAIGKQCKALECFKIDECSDSYFYEVVDGDYQSAAAAAAVSSFLRSVRKRLKNLFWGVTWGAGGLIGILEKCQALESLTILPVFVNKPLQDDLLRVALQQLPRLRNLAIMYTDGKDLCRALSDAVNNNLTALTLNGSGLDDASLIAVAQACPRLLHLRLNSYDDQWLHMSKVGLESIAKRWTLQGIVLDWDNSKYLTLTDIVDVVKTMMLPSLKYMELSHIFDVEEAHKLLKEYGIKVGQVDIVDYDLTSCQQD